MNKLQTALSQGKKSAGLKGFVKCTASGDHTSALYVPITVKGVSATSCEVKVLAEVCSPGIGEFQINPCTFLDDLTAVKEQIKKSQLDKLVSGEIKAIVGDHRGSPFSIGISKQRLFSYVDKLGPKLQKKVAEELIANEHIKPRDGKDTTKLDEWYKQVQKHNVNDIAEVAVRVANNALALAVEEDDDY